MRGPLFSGAIGSPATLQRLAELARTHGPAVVLTCRWLATELATIVPVLLLVEPAEAAAAKRVLRAARREGRTLSVAVAGEQLPVRDGSVGLLILEGLGDVDANLMPGFLIGLSRALRGDGHIVAADNTREVEHEARVAGAMLSAGLRDIAQERPREGAVLSLGRAPRDEVRVVKTIEFGLQL